MIEGETVAGEDIDGIFERIRTWPVADQEEAAMLLLALEERRKGVYELSDDELADLEQADREIERGEFATDEEVKALFDRYRGR